MNFDESVKYLYSLGNEVLAMKLGLENPRRLFSALGNPQTKYKKVQVAGTNGKGSTCAFLDAICRQAGIRTGLYTSPHLVSITERIRINGDKISEADFAKFATKVREISEGEKLYATFFEQITAIALLAFAEKCVELAILETGLGGRLDATTAANAEIVAITPVDYDHQQYLGETLAEIAGEKAAIINSPNQKVVVSKQHAEAEKVILDRCKQFGITPLRTDFNLPKTELGLKGNHQTENAKVALALAEIMGVNKSNILRGLQNATHAGRLEYYNGVLFDGAHNIASAKALRDYLENNVLQPLTLIFGAMKDKQIAEIAETLFPLADKLIITKIENARAASPEDLAKFSKGEVYHTQTSSEALEIAKNFPNNLTCVTGSLYLVGETRKLLDNQK